MMTYTLTDEHAGMRFEAVIACAFPTASKSAIKKVIVAGSATLNGRAVAKGYKVIAGDVVEILEEPVDQPKTVIPNPDVPLTVVYEDATMIAFNKPAGMDCHPNDPTETDTLANGIAARWPTIQGVGDSPLMCGILHRIDGDTSGLVLAAKTQAVYTTLREQFKAHTIVKIYKALVSGDVRYSGRLEHSLAHHPNCPGRIVNAEIWKGVRRPMKAVTNFRPMQIITLEGSPFTLLEVTILTGVTHQIRAQLSLASLPILGDKRYGGAMIPDFKRHFLHAHSVKLVHPTTGATITIKAPLLPELLALIH